MDIDIHVGKNLLCQMQFSCIFCIFAGILFDILFLNMMFLCGTNITIGQKHQPTTLGEPNLTYDVCLQAPVNSVFNRNTF